MTEDVIERRVEDNKLKTTKLYTKTNRLPKWGERFVPGTTACIIEESVLDPINKRLTTYTRNITYQTLMVVEEKCEYTVASDSKEITQCERQAWISSYIYGFARPVEAFGVERYKQNIKKSHKGIINILEGLYPSPPTKSSGMITIPLPQNMKL